MIYKRGGHWHLDVMMCGVRYREGLHTTDRREALRLEKKRVGEIQAGKGASKSGRDFARLPFGSAADRFVEERRLQVSERTSQLDRERLKPLRTFFGETALLRLKASDIAAYQRARLEGTLRLKERTDGSKGVSNRTVNMETTVLRQMMRRAKVWSVVAEDVRSLPVRQAVVGRVLTAEQKSLLFCVAGTKPAWTVAHCAAVLAVSTTCRGVELKHLRWRDVDLFDRHINVGRSKTDAGQRRIPLNADAIAALARLRHRAEATGATSAEHFVFPACENERIDPLRPQKTWRTAWRSLIKAAARQAGSEAATAALQNETDPEAASRSASAAFAGLRFHDLRHQAITELAEAGASEATLMALAGHLSRAMMEHYSHVRMAAKRVAVDGLATGLMQTPSETLDPLATAVH
jgi:integrase